MPDLFLLRSAVARSPDIEAWFAAADPVRELARPWFQRMRGCGDDVRETLHDRFPTACVGDAAFAYVAAFKAHVNVGFFHGAYLPDPAGLLEGDGKRMRHMKIRLGEPVDEAALSDLIFAAYRSVRDARNL